MGLLLDGKWKVPSELERFSHGIAIKPILDHNLFHRKENCIGVFHLQFTTYVCATKFIIVFISMNNYVFISSFDFIGDCMLFFFGSAIF